MARTAEHRDERYASPRRLVMWGAIVVLLLLPLVAMQFTEEVNWTRFDFMVAGILLIGGGAAYEIAARMLAGASQRAVAGALILFVVALIWAQGAVGIF